MYGAYTGLVSDCVNGVNSGESFVSDTGKKGNWAVGLL